MASRQTAVEGRCTLTRFSGAAGAEGDHVRADDQGARECRIVLAIWPAANQYFGAGNKAATRPAIR